MTKWMKATYKARTPEGQRPVPSETLNLGLNSGIDELVKSSLFRRGCIFAESKSCGALADWRREKVSFLAPGAEQRRNFRSETHFSPPPSGQQSTISLQRKKGLPWK
ncbi:MAG: hypothetical protein ACQERN_00610 [Thermodesulfobacteriota bacterium]